MSIAPLYDKSFHFCWLNKVLFVAGCVYLFIDLVQPLHGLSATFPGWISMALLCHTWKLFLSHWESLDRFENLIEWLRCLLRLLFDWWLGFHYTLSIPPCVSPCMSLSSVIFYGETVWSLNSILNAQVFNIHLTYRLLEVRWFPRLQFLFHFSAFIVVFWVSAFLSKAQSQLSPSLYTDEKVVFILLLKLGTESLYC